MLWLDYCSLLLTVLILLFSPKFISQIAESAWSFSKITQIMSHTLKKGRKKKKTISISGFPSILRENTTKFFPRPMWRSSWMFSWRLSPPLFTCLVSFNCRMQSIEGWEEQSENHYGPGQHAMPWHRTVRKLQVVKISWFNVTCFSVCFVFSS